MAESKQTHHIEAIVLDRRPWGEADSEVVLYSKDKGLVELRVRGAKKLSSKMAAHFEPMNTVELMMIKGRQVDYAGGCVARNCRSRIKSDWHKTIWAGQLLSAAKKYLKPEEPDGEIFEAIDSCLQVMDKITGAPSYYYKALTLVAELKILAAIGYAADPTSCQMCGKDFGAEQCWQAPSGEFICQECSRLSGGNHYQVSNELLSAVRSAYGNNFLELSHKWRPALEAVDGLTIIRNNLLYYLQ